MGDEHAYWVWHSASLAHPDGRAAGGEPCVKCGNAIPANTHWTHRDRHVCSSRCNENLKRQWKRLVHKAIEGLPASWNGGSLTEPPAPAPNPRKSGKRNFATLEDAPKGAVPYEWEGYCPLAGDTVERHGVTTSYQVLWGDPDNDDPHERHQYVAIAPTGHLDYWSANDKGEVGGIRFGPFTPAGEPMDSSDAVFWWNGLPLRWYRETIRDVTPDGREYAWVAPFASFAAVRDEDGNVHRWGPEKSTFWSPAYQERSERMQRETASRARHARRVRTTGATAERIDPSDVFAKCSWVCALCGEPVNPILKWPEAMSASLDHIQPLSAGGLHVAGNCQLAHLICNIRKGATFSPPTAASRGELQGLGDPPNRTARELSRG